jgi:hypothetical protein
MTLILSMLFFVDSVNIRQILENPKITHRESLEDPSNDCMSLNDFVVCHT